MDQVVVKVKQTSKGHKTIYADPKMRGYKDLLVRGGTFYAVFDPETNLWSRDIQRLGELIDEDIANYYDSYKSDDGSQVSPLFMQSMSNGCWNRYISSMKYLATSNHILDQRIIFADDKTEREDYASRRLKYEVKKGDISAYDELMSTLYAPEEREKLEWAIGALVDGDSLEKIQKMFVIYGDPGTGKSTILNIIQMLFPGYITYFNAEDLGKGYAFGTALFKDSPLIGIQTDGDLSHMWDNTLLNQISGHETIIINEKGVKQYAVPVKTMLFMATNQPVRITDSRSGIIRRLIDVYPTGKRLDIDTYFRCMDQIKFELGAIAYECLSVYRRLGMNRYSKYKPEQMIARTNDIYAFVLDNIDVFHEKDTQNLSDLWRMYKEWCDDANVTNKLKRVEFRSELESYFRHFTAGPSCSVEMSGFKNDIFRSKLVSSSDDHENAIPDWLDLKEQKSHFDEIASSYPAQYARNDDMGGPLKKWQNVSTTLNDIHTDRLHWVKVPENLIVIDFDIRGDDGEKSLERNIEAARKFPPTYAEVSKSGKGLHLHYLYDSDPLLLKNLYSVNVEIKVYKGNASLRRKLTKCNNLPVNHISSGLPLKGRESMINKKELVDENHLRNIIKNCLVKKYIPGTKPSVEFIKKVTDEMYDSGKPYDVLDMRKDILDFALQSTHWSDYCVDLVSKMHLKSDILPEGENPENEDILTFYDVEVFPNLFMICFSKSDSDTIFTWINPPRTSVATLFKENLVGFNNRKYDNHILWAWAEYGYNNLQLYQLSQKIVSGKRDALFGEAYNLSYTDIYDFSAKKQSLKKWEIELGIDHHELGFPWDAPVDPDKWKIVQSYCEDDVRATKAVFYHLKEDFTARKMLSMMSGLTVNDTTNSHTAKIIFGTNRHPQAEFNFPDLRKTFPGYTFDRFKPQAEKSTYMGEHPGEGGYVWVYGMQNGDEEQDYPDIPHPWEKEQTNE